MIHNITLTNQPQQYQLVARQWVSEINFFVVETSFLQNLLMGCVPMLSDHTFAEKRKITIRRLRKLEVDKNYSDHILNEQFEMLEKTTGKMIAENEVKLACKHLELEFLMTSLNKEYREVKKELFCLVESVLPGHI